jgi:hypothetical protein
LGLGAALRAQEVELFGRFDPFGGGGDAEAAREARNRRDDRGAVAPLAPRPSSTRSSKRGGASAPARAIAQRRLSSAPCWATEEEENGWAL